MIYRCVLIVTPPPPYRDPGLQPTNGNVSSSVGLSAKDLLSKLLTVDLDERITVEECLNHKFLKPTSANSSFDDELEALGLRIEGIEILKQKELLYNNMDSISDTNSYV